MSEPGKLRLAANLQLALRNLDRNRRRTGLTLASLVVGIAALTFLSALNDGWLEINVETFKGTVPLSGSVRSTAAGDEAVDVARRVGGVRSVKNDMRIK